MISQINEYEAHPYALYSSGRRCSYLVITTCRVTKLSYSPMRMIALPFSPLPSLSFLPLSSLLSPVLPSLTDTSAPGHFGTKTVRHQYRMVPKCLETIRHQIFTGAELSASAEIPRDTSAPSVKNTYDMGYCFVILMVGRYIAYMHAKL